MEVVIFLASAIGLLVLCMSLSYWVERREMKRYAAEQAKRSQERDRLWEQQKAFLARQAPVTARTLYETTNYRPIPRREKVDSQPTPSYDSPTRPHYDIDSAPDYSPSSYDSDSGSSSSYDSGSCGSSDSGSSSGGDCGGGGGGGD